MSKFDFNKFSPELQNHLIRRSLKKGERLFVEGDEVEQIFFCESGCVRMEVMPQPNKPLVLYRARDAQALAEEHLMLDHYTYSAISDQDTLVFGAPKAMLLEDIMTKPKIAYVYLQCVIHRYYELRVNFERLGIKSAKHRVLHLLRTLSVQQGGAIDLTGKVKSVSSDLNLTHEATYRALKELENEGLLVREEGVIHLQPQANSVRD